MCYFHPPLLPSPATAPPQPLLWGGDQQTSWKAQEGRRRTKEKGELSSLQCCAATRRKCLGAGKIQIFRGNLSHYASMGLVIFTYNLPYKNQLYIHVGNQNRSSHGWVRGEIPGKPPLTRINSSCQFWKTICPLWMTMSKWAMKKKLDSLGCIGGLYYPLSIGIFQYPNYRNPYWPTSFWWKVKFFFFRGSNDEEISSNPGDSPNNTPDNT